MKARTLLLLTVLNGTALTSNAASSALLGWNNLGMHCMDSDYSVFSILPPYNTVEAQLIVNGRLVSSATSGYTVTYQAVADPDGSINRTSAGKGNFYDWTALLYGSLSPDAGLAGWGMPGPNNTPQAMRFENANQPAPGVTTPVNWYRGEGIPITPYDDALNKNPYPLMRLIAWNSAKQPIATNDVVLPVSDEMDCRACHGSGTQAAAKPTGGWSTDPNPERQYRLNILRLHDEREFSVHNAEYVAALAARGYNAAGLYDSVVSSNQPVLCAACHASEALGTDSFGSIPPLTTSIHSYHAQVMDPELDLTLDNSDNRAACYRCHPGSTTKCLRGAMGGAVATDGSMEMQCQSCHGNMSQVGSTDRVGWFMEPNCQSCHTGTATRNSGQIRYTAVFDATGKVRTAADQTFATNPNTPAPGLSLYRFSKGHGGLQCSACHGSTHAEFPSSHGNDNLSNQRLQGHAGVMVECTACHTTMPTSPNGGPHGMHPIGNAWIKDHHDSVSILGLAQCQSCHGLDSRGTVLSRVQGERSFQVENVGTVRFFRGATVGCYTCHNGPSSSTMNPSAAPTVSNVSAKTQAGQSVVIQLPVSGANATLRIISQPIGGTVGLSGSTATYYSDSNFSGTDTFTFAAYDGAKNSTLATGTVVVEPVPLPLPPVITTQPVSQTVNQGSPVTFSVVATGTAPLAYQWLKESSPIPGATSAALSLSAVSATDAANYKVVVSNTAGSATSTAATLTVLNRAPEVRITAPANGSSFPALAKITLVAEAWDVGGSVMQVSFYSGATRIGIGSATGLIGANGGKLYSFTWSKVRAASYSISARAVDNQGAVSTSIPVAITVGNKALLPAPSATAQILPQ